MPFYILKPSAEAILERLLPLYVRNQIFRALVETAAAEHGARRTAMKNATDNAGDILDISEADLQPGPSGADHAGDRRDRRRRGSTERIGVGCQVSGVRVSLTQTPALTPDT